MKKLIISLLLVVFVICFVTFGCVDVTSVDNKSDTEIAEVSISMEKAVMLSPSSIRKVENASNQPVLKSSFKDDEYYYYLFYLGKLSNVPLDSSFSFLHEYKNMGQSMEIEMSSTVLSASEISSMTSQTVSETVEISSKISSKISAKAGTKNNNVTAELALSLSSSASMSNELTNSYQRASKFSEENQKKVKIIFNENTADGYYGYSPTAVLKMYSLVVYDPREDKYAIDTYSEVEKNWIGFYYYSSLDEFINYAYDTIEFSVPSNLPVPTNEYVDENAWTVVTTKMTRYNCNDGNSYNKGKQEESDVWRSRHDGFEVGELALYGCKQNGNKYRINSKESFSIKWKVLHDVTSLPKVGGASLTKINHDTCKTIHGTNVNSEIKYGAYWLRVTYTDDTQSQYSKTNIMENANSGTIIELLSADQTNKDKKIAKVDVVIVYELYCGGPGFLGVWWKEYTNWRLEYTYLFIN